MHVNVEAVTIGDGTGWVMKLVDTSSVMAWAESVAELLPGATSQKFLRVDRDTMAAILAWWQCPWTDKTSWSDGVCHVFEVQLDEENGLRWPRLADPQ